MNFVETMRENPSQMGGGSVMRALGNDDEQIVVAPCPSSSLISLGGGSCVETAEKNHLRLVFGREGGDGGGRRVETLKITTSTSCLDAREMVVVGEVSEERKKPPPARVWMRGRWWWWQSHRNDDSNHLRLVFERKGGGGGGGNHVETTKRTTSGSRLEAREVVVVAVASKRRQ
jgi:hypothetical protein